MDEMTTQFNLMMGLYGLSAGIWFLAAIIALGSYKAFKQQADLGWFGAFFFLGLARIGYLWEALNWRNSLRFLSTETVTSLDSMTALRLSFGAIELLAALLAIYYFRARRTLL
jgi:hypothetical protein